MTQINRRTLTTLLGAALLLCGGAPTVVQAAPSDEAAQMADFFTGTLEINTMSGQWSARRFLAADHTYRENGSDGDVRGTWKIEDGKLCTTSSRSLGEDRAATYCNVGVGKKAGQAWKDEDPVTGAAVMFKLTPGR